MKSGVGETIFRWFDKVIAIVMVLAAAGTVAYAITSSRKVLSKGEPRQIDEYVESIKTKRNRSKPQQDPSEIIEYDKSLLEWRKSPEKILIPSLPSWIFNIPRPIIYDPLVIPARPSGNRPPFKKEITFKKPLDRGTVKCDNYPYLRVVHDMNNPRVLEVEPLIARERLAKPLTVKIEAYSGEILHVQNVIIDPAQSIDIVEAPIWVGSAPELHRIFIGFDTNPENEKLMQSGQVNITQMDIYRREPAKGESFKVIGSIRYPEKGKKVVENAKEPEVPVTLARARIVFADDKVAPATLYSYMIKCQGKALGFLASEPLSVATLDDVDFQCTVADSKNNQFLFKIRKWVMPSGVARQGEWVTTTFSGVAVGQEIGGKKRGVRIGENRMDVDFSTGCILLGCVPTASAVTIVETAQGQEFPAKGNDSLVFFQDRNGAPRVRWLRQWGSQIIAAEAEKKSAEPKESKKGLLGKSDEESGKPGEVEELKPQQ
ncbi:MAG TPA: hypothetical protein PL033_18600 [Candidatus Brocadiia bacterium]|nr:hypothetical protein [Candidatus Brocadiia bacterium]